MDPVTLFPTQNLLDLAGGNNPRRWGEGNFLRHDIIPRREMCLQKEMIGEDLRVRGWNYEKRMKVLGGEGRDYPYHM